MACLTCQQPSALRTHAVTERVKMNCLRRVDIRSNRRRQKRLNLRLWRGLVARPRHPLNAGLLLHLVRIACVIVVLLVGFGNRERALDRPEPGSGYVNKNFSVEDGLLSNNVNVILQTRDGFLWIGTPDGLLGFDGGTSRLSSFCRKIRLLL